MKWAIYNPDWKEFFPTVYDSYDEAAEEANMLDDVLIITLDIGEDEEPPEEGTHSAPQGSQVL